MLRKAQKCFANQQTHKAFNAFVTAPIDGSPSSQQLQDLQDADARSGGGQVIPRALR